MHLLRSDVTPTKKNDLEVLNNYFQNMFYISKLLRIYALSNGIIFFFNLNKTNSLVLELMTSSLNWGICPKV